MSRRSKSQSNQNQSRQNKDLRIVQIAARQGKAFYYIYNENEGIENGTFAMKSGNTRILFKLALPELLLLKKLIEEIINNTVL